MRLACVYVPRFALAVEARLTPLLLHAPAIVYDGNRVLEASPELTDVHPGQSLRQARAAYPHAVFVAAHLLLYREVTEAIMSCTRTLPSSVSPPRRGRGQSSSGQSQRW